MRNTRPATGRRATRSLSTTLAVVGLLLHSVSGRALAQDEALLDRIAEATRIAFETGTFDAMQDRLADSFLAQVPLAQMNTIPLSFQSAFGKVVDVRFVEKRDDPGGFGADALFFHVEIEGDKRAIMRVRLDAQKKITAWHIGPSFSVTASFEDVRTALEALEGEVSACVRVVGDPEPAFAMYPDRALAVGSAFKLYVLGELLRQVEAGVARLDDVVLLRPEQKSLPSGRMHAWPNGAPVTVHTLATAMISESDNTATDHLIEALGRERIEKSLGKVFRHSHPQRTIPFLKTRELFMLQADREPFASLRQRYLAASTDERREILDLLAEQSHSGTPTDIVMVGGVFDRIEWFMSSRDLVTLLDVLYGDELLQQERTRTALRDILAVNPGIPDSEADGRIEYIGFKGGSEPGVLNFTQAVETFDGRRILIAVTWNNPDGIAKQETLVEIFSSLRKATLDAAE